MQREVDQERWTGLDRTLQREAVDGLVQPETLAEPRLHRQRQMLIGRLQRLQRMGLATEQQTYLHATVSTRRYRIGVPAVPFHLDALLADMPLIGGLAPMLGDAHLRVVTVRGFPATLKTDLDRYAAMHAQTYGEAVDATTLIPHMLEAFMAGDRGFKKGTTAKATPPKQP